MLFNKTAIAAKNACLDAILDRPDLLRNVIQEFAGDGVEAVYHVTKRAWEPGGGATLFQIRFGSREAFLKVKSTAVTVESKLEGEKEFIAVPSVRNEFEFLQRLQGVSENVPKLLGYSEKDGFCFLFLEKLIPWRAALDSLSPLEVLTAFRQIEATVRTLFERDMVHTDVHENNLMFRDKTPVLIDFEEARYLAQDIPFERSLDVAGENAWGNVGFMPEGYGFAGGYTCLNRLRTELSKVIVTKLPELIKQCNFDSSCSFLATLDHGRDDRIYQSINLPGIQVAGQRPLEDSRIRFLGKVCEKLFDAPVTHLDIGSNLGRFNLELSRTPMIRKSIGVEAYGKYVELSNLLAFLINSSKVEFFRAECGQDSLYELLKDEQIQLVTVYSTYHHITNKERFLADLAKLNPSYVVIEAAVQEECYGRDWKTEIIYICNKLKMGYAAVLGFSEDYQRPIVLLSHNSNVEKLIAGQTRPSAVKVRLDDAQTPPLVSVVLPTYNHLTMLPVSIGSVLAQTFTNFELIIVNDGSTDGTRDYLDRISEPRIRVIHQENKRLPGALNAGFEAARGRYFTWTSDDNYCSPGFLGSLVEALDRDPGAGFAYSAFAWIDERNRIKGVHRDQDFSYPSLLRCNPGNASFLYRRECQETVGRYDPELEGAEDWDMWLRIREHFEPVYVPQILYYYRLHDKSMTATQGDMIRRSSQLTFRKALGRHPGGLTLESLYPSISECRDGTTATLHACLDMGEKMMTSPWFNGDYAQLAIFFLTKAVELCNSPVAAGNLAAAYALLGQGREALQIARRLEVIDHPLIRNLYLAIANSNGMCAGGRLPLLVMDKSRSELFQLESKRRRTAEDATSNSARHPSPTRSLQPETNHRHTGCDPEHLRALVGEAHRQYLIGNRAAAVELLQKALAVAPENARFLTRLASLMNGLGEVSLAREAARRALSLDRNDSGALSLAHQMGLRVSS